MEFNFQTGNTEIIVFSVMAVILAYGVHYFYEKRHGGGHNRTLASVLKFVRFLSFAVIFILALSPVFSFTKTSNERGRVLFIMDESGSMGFKNENSSRFNEAISVINSEKLIEKISANNEVYFGGFSGEFYNFKSFDEMSARTPAGTSDITNVVAEVLNKPEITAVVLISDGRSTSPNRPEALAKFLKAPFYTIGAGNSKNLKDLSISAVNHPKTGYLNEKTEMNVEIINNGYDNLKSVITLRENGNMVKQQPVNFDQGRVNVKIAFNPRERGLVRYDIELAGADGELTLENNKYPLYMNVIEHKLRLLYIESYPRQDFSFFQKYITSNKDTVLKAKFMESPNSKLKLDFNDIGNFDILILGNIDFTKMDAKIKDKLSEEIQKNRSSVLFMGGPEFKLNKDDIFSKYFPLDLSEGIIYEPVRYKPVLTNFGLNNQIAKISPISKINSYIWDEVPELAGISIVRNNSAETAGGFDASVILSAKINSKLLSKVINAPVAAVKNSLAVKSAGILGESFWFLKFGLLSSKNSMLYDKFLGNLLIWLYSKDDSVTFKVETDKTNYFAEDNIYVMINARNADYSPMRSPAFNVTLKDGAGAETKIKEIPVFVDNGYYEFSFKAPKSGQYELTADAAEPKGAVMKSAAKFIVNNSSREFLSLGPDFDLLKTLAEKSGGKYYELKNAGSLPGDLPQKGRMVTTTTEYRPMEENTFFWLIFIMLSLEWAVRRFIGFE
ncbi:MAG: VWA domain-containing protein [Candidatus Wallbacteria bacterium]